MLAWMFALPAHAQSTCTAIPQRVTSNSSMAPGPVPGWTVSPFGSWTANLLGDSSAQHWDNQGGITPALPTSFDSMTQPLTDVSGGGVLQFDVAWNNAMNDTFLITGNQGWDGNGVRLVISYGGTQYVEVLTSPFQNLNPAGAGKPGPTTGSSLSALNGATLLSGTIPTPSTILSGSTATFNWSTLRVQLPDNIPQDASLVIGVQRVNNGMPDGETDDIYVRNVTVSDRTLCVIKNTPNGPGGNFVFSAPNLDANLVTAGTQSTFNITTAGATSVAWDADTGTAGSQPAIVNANPVIITETSLASLYQLTGAVCDNGVSVSVSGSAATIGTIPAGTQVSCTLTNRRLFADLSIAKTNTPSLGALDQSGDTLTKGTTTSYSIVVTNNGPDAATGAILKDPASSRTGLTCTTPPTCSGSACPAGPLTVASLDSGLVLGTLANGASVTLTLICTVQ